MKPASARLRVHFAPVGLEIARVVEPMKTLRADAAVLLTLSKTDRARFSLEKITELLAEEEVEAHTIECNIWDASAVVNEVGAVISASPQHDFFFNVSTGAKTACMGGLISGMFWQIKPYYIAVNYGAKPVHNEQDYPVSGEPQFVPTFEIPVLDDTAVKSLAYITSGPNPLQKRDLLEYLRQTKVIGPRQKSQVSIQALHGQVDSILHRLQEWGFIELRGRGKELRIVATEKGRAGNRMFHHVLNPRPPLPILA